MRALAAAAGSAALLALAIAASRHADETALSPIRPDGGWRAAWILGLVGSFALYVAGVALVRRPSRAAVLAVAAFVQLVPLAAPVLLSRDVHLYWDFGRIAAIHDGNPFAETPADFPRDPAYAGTAPGVREVTLPYGPAFAGLAEAHATVAGEDASTATWLYRALAALTVLGIAALVAARGATAAAIVGWNPLLALHFGGGGHNDGLMMLPIVAGLVLAARRPRLEGPLWAVAAAVKWIPLIFLPLEVLARRRRGLVLAAGFVTGALVVSALAAMRYGTTRTAAAAAISRQVNDVSSISAPYWLMELFGAPERLAILFCAACFGVAYLWLARAAWRGRARLGLCAGLLLLAVPWLQPWYALWPLSLSAWDEDRTARLLALVLSAYFLRDALPL